MDLSPRKVRDFVDLIAAIHTPGAEWEEHSMSMHVKVHQGDSYPGSHRQTLRVNQVNIFDRS